MGNDCGEGQEILFSYYKILNNLRILFILDFYLCITLNNLGFVFI